LSSKILKKIKLFLLVCQSITG